MSLAVISEMRNVETYLSIKLMNQPQQMPILKIPLIHFTPVEVSGIFISWKKYTLKTIKNFLSGFNEKKIVGIIYTSLGGLRALLS